MGHLLRNDAPDRIFHVTARVNWRAWHLDDDHAKRTLARLVVALAAEFRVRLWAWVVMANHFHLVAQSPSRDAYRRLTGRRTASRHFRPWPAGHQNSSVIAQFMRGVRRTMSVQRQKELGVSGKFWESKYDARRVDHPVSLICRIAYDHRNPVKAGIVARPEEYVWSSAREWVTGQIGIIPLTLPEAMPFGLALEDLRDDILQYQESRLPDDIEEAIRKQMRSRSGVDPEAVRALLGENGVVLRCVSAAAKR